MGFKVILRSSILEGACLKWVIFDRDTGGRKFIHVRSIPNSDRKFDPVVSVASCHNRTHAVQRATCSTGVQ